MSEVAIDDGFTRAVRAALSRLGVERLVLSIHQVSFPAGAGDIGFGTPYGPRGTELLQTVTRLGFTGVALGPHGITSRINPSPYDGSVFSRNPLHASFVDLVDQGLLDPSTLEAAAVPPSERADYEAAWDRASRLLARAATARLGRGDSDTDTALGAFRARSPWLEEDARYEGATSALGHDDWTRWPAQWPVSVSAVARFEVEQLLLAEQHAKLRQTAKRLGLHLYADIAIGTSFRDRALYGKHMLAGYAMGAPPSRTNPDGQPWGYPILNPQGLAPGGGARSFLEARVEQLLADYDGIRVDHPHGWVCPWVYRTDAPDPLVAVQSGARLFESPDLTDHPALARFARVRPDQLDRSRARYADDWVKSLEPEQVDRYSVAFDVFVDRVLAAGGSRGDLMVEVLSTCPRPLAAVLARHGLGRFRVTQKAKTTDPSDVYRSENARPEDWIMMGNHDTPPIALVVSKWAGTVEAERRAAYLAERLAPSEDERGALARELASDPRALTEAMLAELFVGPAKNVLVFWADLFGERRIYNRPGEVHPENWTLRVPPDFEAALEARSASGEAPHLGRALARALRARNLDRDPDGVALRDALLRGPR